MPDQHKRRTINDWLKTWTKLFFQTGRMVWLLINPHTIGVRILLIRDEQVLLVKHTYEKEWFLPGGIVERGESLVDAVKREAFEETGAYVENVSLLGVHTKSEGKNQVHVVTYLADEFEIRKVHDEEIEETRFFPLDELPETISPGSGRRIEEAVQGLSATFGDW